LVVSLANVKPASAQTPFAVPQGSPLPRILPATPPSTSAPSLLAPPSTPAGAIPAVDVKVTSTAVVGVTRYNASDLAALQGDLIGPAIPLARIEAARSAILNHYRDDGFVLTTVNASLDAAGHLRFVVVEGRIVDVKLDGDIGPAGTQVLRFLRHLTNGEPVNNAALERWLLLAQDIPGISLHAILQPSADDPGALTLVAQVKRQAVSGLITADNRGYGLSGPEQGLVVLDLNSFTQFGEKTEFSFFDTARSTQPFGQASTELFAGSSGLKIRLYIGHGETTPSGFLNAIGYDGTTTVVGVQASYPLIRARVQTLNLTLGFDATDSEITTEQNAISQRLSHDSLRIVRLGADYVVEDLLLGASRSATNLGNLHLSQGISGLGATGAGNPTPSRAGERTDFFKATATLSRTQTLFQPWNGASIALKGTVAGQASPDILPATETFYLGGAEFNRGFYSGEVTGDQALTYSAELQLNTSFSGVIAGQSLNMPTQFYVFYDGGEVWQHTSQQPNARLTSEGIGVRLNVTPTTELGLEGVIRNTRTFGATSAAVRPLPADAIYWHALARF
jgi:hemolysin activation/secretion protein